MKRLNIAYITTYDAKDINNWSGLGYYIAKTVEKHLGNVTYIGNINPKRLIRHKVKSLWYKKITGKNYDVSRTAIKGRAYAREVEKQLKGKNFDLIFSPGTIPIAYLETKTPIVFWTDANFHGMIDYYFGNLCEETIRDGNQMEKTALEKSKLAIYSSEWAAKGAIEFYKIKSDKVKVIPFGANISDIPKKNELKYKLNNPLHLLFVGKDWKRKGGEVAFETMKSLNEQGVETYLTVVGCVPPISDERMEVIPFINKNNKEEANILRKLYINADFFIMPSRKECYGVVFCEANAFGTPILSTKTGGIPTIVKDGVNGYLLPLEANGKDYAKKIIQIIEDGVYEKLCILSRSRYEEVLNWDKAGEELKKEISKIL